MPDPQLAQRLERDLRPLYLVLGDARPLVVEAVDTIEAAGLARAGLAAFNHGTWRCTEGNADQAISAARTPPMMGDFRVVVIRELEEANDAFYTSLVDYLGSPSPTTVLILSGAKLPKPEKGRPAWARKIKDAFKKAKGEWLEFDTKSVDSKRYAADLAASQGKRLHRDAASYLIENVGDELDRLRGEVNKLVLYVGEREVIGVDDVREACAVLAEAEIWDLTASLAGRDRPRAIEALYRLQSSGDEPRRILSMIAWQSRQLLEMAELARTGASDDAIRRVSRMRWDTFKQVRPLLEEGVPSAEDLLRRLAAANRDMNSHRAGAERILDGLVLEMLV